MTSKVMDHCFIPNTVEWIFKCGRFTYLSLDYSSGNKIKLVKIRIALFVSVASAKSLNHLMTSLMTNQTKLERSRFLN